MAAALSSLDKLSGVRQRKIIKNRVHQSILAHITVLSELVYKNWFHIVIKYETRKLHRLVLIVFFISEIQ